MSRRRSTELRRRPTSRRGNVSRLKQQARRGGACEARPSRVKTSWETSLPVPVVAAFAAWAEKATEGARTPHSGEPKRKRKWPSSRREVDGAATGDAHEQGTTTPLGEAVTADAGADGGARDAARVAEKAKASKLSARHRAQRMAPGHNHIARYR